MLKYGLVYILLKGEVSFMGLYLILYWVTFFITVIFYIIYRRKRKEIFSNLSMFFGILMMFFLLFALATKDPIDELVTTIPVFWQFMLTALTGAGAIWKLYLAPLKIKVYGIDREVGELKTSINKVEKNVDILIDSIIKKKK